jgi:hypothetical protein
VVGRSIAHRDRRGADRVSFTAARGGRYRVLLTPTALGTTGLTHTVIFER